MQRALATDHAEEAAALEAEAARVDADRGDDAGALLVEAANQWRLAGDLARCRALIASVIERGGEAGCFARAELAVILLDTGDGDSAYAELAALAADPSLTEGPCQIVAETLADHGALEPALEWYDRVVAGWSEERRAAATAEHPGRRSMDRVLVDQRQRIRKRLGFPPEG
jgi:hypothetical protein